MAGTGSFEVFDFTELGKRSGGIGSIRTYSQTIIPYLRTRSYDALMRGAHPESREMLAREDYCNAVCNRMQLVN